MDNGASVLLECVSDNVIHRLSSTECVVGRGWLTCNDKKISRNHGILKIISASEIAVRSTHQNCMFFRKRDELVINPILQDSEVNLSPGDSFGLLVDAFWFRLHDTSADNGGAAGSNTTDVASGMNGSTAASSCVLKRQSANDSESDSANKRARIETNGTDAVASSDAANHMPSTSNNLGISIHQPIKSEVDSNDVLPPSAIKPEPIDPDDDVEPATAQEDVVVKQEPSGTDTAETPAQVETNPSPTRRICCRYGMRCYRRNPIHRSEEAHPGDVDYQIPDIPPIDPNAPMCPFLDRCYRRNPTHFHQFSHKLSSQKKKNGYEATAVVPNTQENVSDGSESEEDPFATDGDSDEDFTPGDD